MLTDELLPMSDIKDIGKELITCSKLKLQSDPLYNNYNEYCCIKKSKEVQYISGLQHMEVENISKYKKIRVLGK